METARGLSKLRGRKKMWLLLAKLAFPGKSEAKNIVTLLVLYLLLGSGVILGPSADRRSSVSRRL